MNQTIEVSLFFVISLSLLLILSVAGLAFLYQKVKLLEEQKEEIKQINQKLEQRVFPLEMESIKYKLNPHLFKNVLNSIQSHAYQTYYSLDKLSNVLDYVLYESDQQMVSIKEETDFILNLIEINRLKVSPLFDLRIKNKISETNEWIRKKVIAPLITVDLVENAFKHSDLQSEDAFISIIFEVANDHFILVVTNKISSAPTLKKERSGFGKDNFIKRLDIVYKNNYKLNHFVEDDTYTAQLKINLRGYQTEVHSS